METKKIYSLHDENKEWLSDLLFCQDDIKVLKNRLEEIATKNTSKEILTQVEHFQNQFIIQLDTIDNLKHELNINNDEITREIEKNDVALERRKMEDHTALREKVAYFMKHFHVLKTEFNVFLSKWM